MLTPESSPLWTAYVGEPSIPKLVALVGAMSLGDRPRLIHAVERQFARTQAWKIAHHAALLHLDEFAPHSSKQDLIKALYFANYACTNSANDPRARLTMAQLNWERRLPLGVLHDVRVVQEGEAILRANLTTPMVSRVIGMAFVLEGMARAYLNDAMGAWASLTKAETHGHLTVEALAQLLLAAEPGSPAASDWACARLPLDIELPGRFEARRRSAIRRQLISIFRQRAEQR